MGSFGNCEEFLGNGSIDGGGGVCGSDEFVRSSPVPGTETVGKVDIN